MFSGRTVKETHIKIGIESNNRQIPSKFDKLAKYIVYRKTVTINHLLSDACDLGDLARDLAGGFDKGLKCYVRVTVEGRPNRPELNDFVSLGTEPRRLEIQYNDFPRQKRRKFRNFGLGFLNDL